MLLAEQKSREFLLTLDTAGTITWADRRAARLLGAAPGMPLSALAVNGTEARLAAVIQRARREDVSGCEVAVLSGKTATTACLCTRRGSEGALHVHGALMAETFSEAISRLNETLADVVELNREIARQKKELASKHEQLTHAYRDLEESNKGVLSLHAELADKADALRRAAEVKGRVVANVSHEFRTPLHTILGLSRLLLDSTDGPLTDEQSKQVRFIRTAAEELHALVNDMLDLSKTESGRAVLRPEAFSASDLFAALRGMLRPLVSTTGAVELVFEPPPELELDTDRGKVAQIVRNLVSNALKFTERGQVRVSARREGDTAVISVSDTGIGIKEDDFDHIFEEFGQVESPLQERVKGTGLGLALSRKLAEFLGGTLDVQSQVGVGSTFTLRIPRQHPEVRELSKLESRPLDPSRAPVLVVEDDRNTSFIYEKYLAMGGFQVVPARNVEDARRLLETVRPQAIVLDIMLEGESSWRFLADVKSNPATRDIPVLVVTVTSKEQKARALGADEFWIGPVDKERLLDELRSLVKPGAPARVLVIDDDDRARYVLKRLLDRSPYELLEAGTGPERVALARERRPHVILLDFLLRDRTAFDVLDELEGDPRTRGIPVIVVTSHVLDEEALERLSVQTDAILSKDSLSRELAIQRIRDALSKAGVSASGAPEAGHA